MKKVFASPSVGAQQRTTGPPKKNHGVKAGSLITPREQVWKGTSEKEHELIEPIFASLDKQDEEDLAIALVTWLRFGFRRPFDNEKLRSLLDVLINLVITERSKYNNN